MTVVVTAHDINDWVTTSVKQSLAQVALPK
jgi:hypothetical protein